MNKMKHLFNTLRINRIGRISVTSITAWRPDLKVWRYQFGQILRLARLVMGGLNRSTVVQVSSFLKYLARLYKTNGSNGVVKYLKTAHVMLIQSVPGSVLQPNSREIGKVAVSRCRDGLPRIIPRIARVSIRAGHAPTIRLWLTLLGIYRVLPAKGKVDYSTITAPGVPIPALFVSQWTAFLPSFLTMVGKFTEDPVLGKEPTSLEPPEVYANTKIGANASTKFGVSSFGARVHAARMWCTDSWDPTLYNYLVEIKQVGLTKCLWQTMWETAYTPAELVRASGAIWEGQDCYGKLSIKVEAAGKHRVFAMVDYWTQCALRPLHRYLGSILKRIPQDGTFDQIKPVAHLLKHIPESQKIYSFDLTAATDRLPLLLQELLMGSLFNTAFGKAWADLLVCRPFYCSVREKVSDPKFVQYEVGQPIGAYSSWVILALTHHALIQFSWYSSGERSWFLDYAILGDDVIIANDTVAKRYQEVCATIGLGIGIPKSLIATGKTCEFAKRFFFRGEDVSGLPHNLWHASSHSASVALALVQRATMVQKQTFTNVALALGSGYKAALTLGATWDSIPRRLRVLAVLFSHPTSQTVFQRASWVEWLTQRGPILPIVSPLPMIEFGPWAQAIFDGLFSPLYKVLDQATESIFWRQPSDLAGRLLDSKVNGDVVRLQESFAKVEASLKHLQKLNLKFMTHQSTAIFSQVTAVLDRINELSRTAYWANQGRPEQDELQLPVLTYYETWLGIRDRVGAPRITSNSPRVTRCRLKGRRGRK